MYDLFDDGGAPTWPAHFPDPAPDPFGSDLWNLLSAQVTEGVEDVFSQVSARLSGEAPPLIERDDFIMPPAAPLKAEPTYGPMSTYGNDEPTEVEEVVITAQPGMPIDEINQILDDLYGGNGVDPGQPTGGGGNNSDPAEEECGCPSTGASQEQEEARSSAAEGADIILQQNWENQEYGGFIYRDAITGEIKMGVITGSAVTTWSPSADNMQGISSYSQIIGIVHSHGPNVPGSNHNFPSSGDWDAFNALITMGAINLTAYYIVGADGQLREYDGVDQTNTNSGEVVSGC